MNLNGKIDLKIKFRCVKTFRRVKKKFILGEKNCWHKKILSMYTKNILKINEEKLSPFLSEKRKFMKKLTNFPYKNL